MLFTINEINRSTDLLPDVIVGYRIYDSCANIVNSIKLVLALTNRQDKESASHEESCTKPAQVQAIMGESSSSPCTAIASVIGPFHIPVVGRGIKAFLLMHMFVYFNILMFYYHSDQPLCYLCLPQ